MEPRLVETGFFILGSAYLLEYEDSCDKFVQNKFESRVSGSLWSRVDNSIAPVYSSLIKNILNPLLPNKLIQRKNCYE